MQDQNYRAIQLRRYLHGDMTALVEGWVEYLNQHPDDIGAALDYAEDVIISKSEGHYSHVLALLSQICDKETGEGIYYQARILQLSGDVVGAVALLKKAPKDPGFQVITPAAYAGWLCAEAGIPQACTPPPMDNLLGAIVGLRLAFIEGNRDRQARALECVLNECKDYEIHDAWRAPAGRPDVCPALWLTEAIMQIGRQALWLTERSDELRSLCGLLDINLEGRPNLLERHVVEHLKAGRIAESCLSYIQLVEHCHRARSPVPRVWTKQPVHVPPKGSEARQHAIRACEGMILSPNLDNQALNLWYEHVWVRVLEDEPLATQSGVHRALMARTGSSAARYRAASVLVASGRLNDARRIASPLLDQLTWREKTRTLLDLCDAQTRRQRLTMVEPRAQTAASGRRRV